MDIKQVDLAQKLADLAARIESKRGLTEQYKTLVMKRLGVVKSKIQQLLTKQSNLVTKIKSDSKTQLTALGKKLGDLRSKDKKEGEEAGKQAQDRQSDLSAQIDSANKEIDKLQEQLRQPNPDLESLKDVVENLNTRLEKSAVAQRNAENDIAGLREQIASRDQLIEQLTKGATDALDLVAKLITTVEEMSITGQDMEDVEKLFNDTESVLDKELSDDGTSGSAPDDGNMGIANLFQDSEPEEPIKEISNEELLSKSDVGAAESVEQNADASGADIEAPKVEEDKDISTTDLISQVDLAPVDSGAEGAASEDVQIDAQELKEDEDVSDTWKDSAPEKSSLPPKKTRKQRRELSDLMNKERNQGQLQDMLKAAGTGGRRTKRRKMRIKTIKKGGYVIHKNRDKSSRKKHHKKKKRTSSGSSRSSSSSDKSSRKTSSSK